MGMCFGAETIKPQSYVENYLQLRNADSGKNSLPRERGHQLKSYIQVEKKRVSSGPPRPRLSTTEIYVPQRNRGQGKIDRDRL